MKIDEVLTKRLIKITSINEPLEREKFLIGGIWRADYVSHTGEGIYGCQIQDNGKFYILTSCRLRFINPEKNPEYFL